MDAPQAVANAIDRFAQVLDALANPNAVLGFVLVVGVVFWIAMLLYVSAKEGDFQLSEALRGPDRRVSKFALVMFSCLFAGLWAFVLYAIQGKMTDSMFLIVFLFGTGSPVASKLADVVVSRWGGVPPTPDMPAPLAPTVKVTQTDGSTVTEVKS